MINHLYTIIVIRTTVFIFIALLFAVSSCGKTQEDTTNNETRAVPVTLEKEDGKFQIYRDGTPYYIQGVGGSRELEKLVSMGGNSIRTWSTNNAGEILDRAHELGLTVMLGIWLEHERHGFDYDDEEAVREQKEEVRQKILRYKDHPALLAWGLGNEVDLMYTNTRVWHAVEDIAQMVKELDPNHLVTTVTAGIDREKAQLIMEKVPSIDYLSINTYAGLEGLPETVREVGLEGAYAVTEWGPTGHWEIANTGWGVPIEQTSTEKAEAYLHRYESAIEGDPEKCIGSYAFLWGQKQETTPTWYGMFLESGHLTEVADAMQYAWTGEWPEDRAPGIEQFLVNGQTAYDDIYLEAGQVYEVALTPFHPHDEPYEITWEFLPESTDIGAGGDPEERPTAIEGLIVEDLGDEGIRFRAPDDSGPYRIFAYVTNDHNKAATANVPFYVN